MDRKPFAVCAGAALVLGGVLGFAWTHAGTAFRLGSPADAAPPLLDVGSNSRCSWKRLDANFSAAAAEAVLKLDSEEPFVELALPLAQEDQSNEAPAPAPLGELDVEPAPAMAEDPPALPAATEGEGEVEGTLVREPENVEPLLAQPVQVEPAPSAAGIAEPETTEEVAEEVAEPASAQMAPTQLPWSRPHPHTREMMAVLSRADERVRHGFELAQHGAVFSARGEFIAALQLIAQASDAQQSTQLYTKALSAGLTAIKEAGVFVRQSADRPDVDLAQLIANHKTSILKHGGELPPSATVAAQRYYTYAQEQLSVAAAREMNGSMALFGMGKVAAGGNLNHARLQVERTAQAMAFYQAALMADNHNFLAANELAVLEVENGNLNRARELLVHSVGLAPQAATWRNLMVVHTRLGEKELAAQAQARLQALPKSAQMDPSLNVHWLDPATFAGTTSPTDGLIAPSPGAAIKAPVPAAPSKATPAAATTDRRNSGVSDLLPWTSRR